MTQVMVVLGIVGVVAAVALAARLGPVERSRPVGRVDLEPGLYLLTSSGCDTCETARRRLQRSGLAYREVAWQDSAPLFSRLGIDAVPSLVQMDEDGHGRWWRGGIPLRFRLRRVPDRDRGDMTGNGPPHG